MDQDPYAVLGVSPTAAPEVVKAAFKALSKVYHPDSGTTPDGERMREINQAYGLIGDPARRAEFDADRAAAGAGGSDPWADDPVAPTSGHAGWGDDGAGQGWGGYGAPPPPPGQYPGGAPPPPGAAPGPAPVYVPPPPMSMGGAAGFPPVPSGRRMGTLGSPTTNTLAWVSFLVTVLCFLPLGLALAIVAHRQIARSNGLQKGMGWVYLTYGWACVGLVVLVALFASMGST